MMRHLIPVSAWLILAARVVDAARYASIVDADLLAQSAAGILAGGDTGPYELNKQVGSGAYGTVYLATQKSTGRVVVVKNIRLTPEGAESFANEFRIWKHMSKCKGFPQVNVVEYVEVFKSSKDMGAVVMEVASGGTLSDRLYSGVSADSTLGGVRKDFGTTMLQSEDEALFLFTQLAAGVQWLAQCGIIHKDLKPDNIGFTESGTPKILDFGLASLLTDRESNGDANMYYNMEQAIVPAQNPAGALRFDSFALGMLLAELGTGVPPFFNPDYDYFSRKNGNLQGEKGLLYITETKKNCAKGDAGIWYPKRRLAGNARALHEAVGEVAGRQFFFIDKGTHYMYSAGAGGGGQAIPTQYAQASWLFRSKTAMSLLASLMEKDLVSRLDLRSILSHAWFKTGPESLGKETESYQLQLTAQQTESMLKPTGTGNNAPILVKPSPSSSTSPAGPSGATKFVKNPAVVATGIPRCKQKPEKDTTSKVKRICRLSNPTHELCIATVSCEGGDSVEVKMEAGYGLTRVSDCYNCEP